MPKAMKIGLFDSGQGGLTVLKRLQNAPELQQKNIQYVYFADNLHCPYGEKSVAEIESYVKDIVSFLKFKQNCNALVMACNTSAAVAKATAIDHFDGPVFDLITPATAHIAKTYKSVLILATNRTVQQNTFGNGIHSINPEIEVIQRACPKLVPLIEDSQADYLAISRALKEYLYDASNYQAVILGCTHYPLLAQQIKDLLPISVAIVDPATFLPKVLVSELLSTTEYTSNSKAANTPVQFYTSGPKEIFQNSLSTLSHILDGDKNNTVFEAEHIMLSPA